MEKALSEKAKYEVVWRDPEKDFVTYFFDGFKGEIRAGQTLIDFGCGTARVTRAFLAKGLNVTLVDISPYALDEEIRNLLILLSNQVHFIQACLWQLPKELKTASWIYCCDVLEHIPEDHLDLVLGQIAERMRIGGYFSICLKEDLTVKNKAWWEKKLAKYFSIVGEDLVAGDLYFNCRVAPRKPRPAL